MHSPQATGVQIALRLLFNLSADMSNVSRLKRWRTGMEEAVGQQLLQITLDRQLGQPLAINALRAAPATNALRPVAQTAAVRWCIKFTTTSKVQTCTI